MVGKPAPQEPSAPSMIPPAKPPANPPAAPGPTSNLPTGPAPIGRNSPSAAAVNSMADVSSGGHDQRRRRRASSTDKPARLVSLDAFRGFIMMMLAASGFGLLAFSRIDETSPVWTLHDRALWQRIGFHFDHPAHLLREMSLMSVPLVFDFCWILRRDRSTTDFAVPSMGAPFA